MATFVDLVEATRVECGVSGSKIVSVQNLSGSLNRIRQWVADAWYELQTSRDDWKWMYQYYEFSLTALKQKYTPAEAGVPNLNVWNEASFWIDNPAIGRGDQQPIGWMEWEHFREMYIRGNQSAQRPMCFTVHPNKSLYFGPLPDLPYAIACEAWTEPYQLVNDTDVPSMPEKFHGLLKYIAMGKYATYESANEVALAARNGATPLMQRLLNSQTPEVTVDGGL